MFPDCLLGIKDATLLLLLLRCHALPDIASLLLLARLSAVRDVAYTWHIRGIYTVGYMGHGHICMHV